MGAGILHGGEDEQAARPGRSTYEREENILLAFGRSGILRPTETS
jgi:hypothetical protein